MLVYRKIWVLCFLETPVFRFALLPYYRRFYRLVLPFNLMEEIISPYPEALSTNT